MNRSQEIYFPNGRNYTDILIITRIRGHLPKILYALKTFGDFKQNEVRLTACLTNLTIAFRYLTYGGREFETSMPYLSITFCICVFTHVHYICIQNVLLSKTFKQHYHLGPSLAMTNFKVQTLFMFKNE